MLTSMSRGVKDRGGSLERIYHRDIVMCPCHFFHGTGMTWEYHHAIRTGRGDNVGIFLGAIPCGGKNGLAKLR